MIKKSVKEIPENWKFIKLKEGIKLSSGKIRPTDFSRTKSNIYIYPIYGGNGILGYSKSFLIDFNSIIIGRVGEYCGSIHLSTNKSWISDNAMYITEFLDKKLDILYLKFVLEQLNLNKFKKSSGQPLITQNTIFSQSILVPPIIEQSRITSIILNIDKNISHTQYIIENLHNLKKGLMQRLFTQGIGHTAFKETKLGRIPEKWEIIKFQELILKIKRGESKKTNSKGKGVIYLTSDYIQDNKILWENKKYLITEKDIGPYLLEEDDIIINCVNSFAKVGKVALFKGYTQPVVIGFNNFAVKINLDILDPDYLVYYFNSEKGYKQIMRTIKPAVNQVSFSSKDVYVFKIILPPLKEQKIISSIFLNIDKNIEKELGIQNSLKSLKKGLMQDLLTGKKRVKFTN